VKAKGATRRSSVRAEGFQRRKIGGRPIAGNHVGYHGVQGTHVRVTNVPDYTGTGSILTPERAAFACVVGRK